MIPRKTTIEVRMDEIKSESLRAVEEQEELYKSDAGEKV